MPVSLDAMMAEAAPEERARSARDASALAAAYRLRGGKAEPEPPYPSSERVAVGAKVRTGQRCPESGIWCVETVPSAAMPIAIHDPMPPYRDRAVTWELVQHAAA